jgi:septal ring factor EnvC (AmiA/AmiB activator)
MFRQYTSPLIRLCSGMAFLVAALLLALWQPCALAQPAQHVTGHTRQKQEAEKERADLQRKLVNLQRDINRTETAKDHAADALAESGHAVSMANRSLRELAREQADTEVRLGVLVKQQSELSSAVKRQQTQLSSLLREQYVAGNEDRIKLLLSGDNPNRINRELQYMGYVSQMQARLIEALRVDLQAIEDNKATTQHVRLELEEIAQEENRQKKLLEKEQARHSALLTQLSAKLAAQRREAGNLQRNEQRLSHLVDKLAQIIEEQKKAAAAREKRRQERLDKARRDKRILQQAGAAPEARSHLALSDATDADEESPALGRNDATPVPEENFGQTFAGLRGRLRLPVRGDLIARFGGKRGDGPSWKGIFIRALEGAEVKAVAAGRVVYADWLRGFGNLLIIDHGDQYMSIYGNNQSVLKRVGDLVKTGDVIASAGNSGGNEQSGLYFETRHRGRAFDPLGWVTTR